MDDLAPGLLAPAGRLNAILTAVAVVLTVVCAWRYVERHGLHTAGVLVLIAAAVLALAQVVRPRLPQLGWMCGVLLLWAGLTVAAPSFSWTAIPVAFAVLQVAPFAVALVLVALMAVLVSVAWLRIGDWIDPTVIVGPIGLALVTVVAFRALQNESRTSRLLLDELTAAQAELVTAQRQAGALAERTRLSRDIHDSVGQSLSSINLMLHAAEQNWDREPARARDQVATAASTARGGLDEVRRVVRDLAPASLDNTLGDEAPSQAEPLVLALRALVDREAAGLDAQVVVHGQSADPLPEQLATALLHTARGALANVIEHAQASTLRITLTQLRDEVLLDVWDDGVGLDPDRHAAASGAIRGHGLAGLADRARALDGQFSIDSEPGEGTTVSIALPLPESSGEPPERTQQSREQR